MKSKRYRSYYVSILSMLILILILSPGLPRNPAVVQARSRLPSLHPLRRLDGGSNPIYLPIVVNETLPDARILFSDNPDFKEFQIFSTNPDRTDQKQITFDSADHYDPAGSPDGNKIVYSKYAAPLIKTEIYIMNSNGTGDTRLTTNSFNDNRPSFSPDGTKIVFESDREVQSQLFWMYTDGSSQTRITDGTASDCCASWSPDGNKIAFSEAGDVYSINVNGSGKTNLTHLVSASVVTGPDWSPDGTQIVFASNHEGDYEIYRMQADGSNIIPLTDNTSEDMEPRWSPDGSKIAFLSDRDGISEVYLMNPDGTKQVQITDLGWFVFSVTWLRNP